MMPTEIGGAPCDVQTMSGADILAQMAADPDYQSQMQGLQDKLTSKGKTINDMSIAMARSRRIPRSGTSPPCVSRAPTSRP